MKKLEDVVKRPRYIYIRTDRTYTEQQNSTPGLKSFLRHFIDQNIPQSPEVSHRILAIRQNAFHHRLWCFRLRRWYAITSHILWVRQMLTEDPKQPTQVLSSRLTQNGPYLRTSVAQSQRASSKQASRPTASSLVISATSIKSAP